MENMKFKNYREELWYIIKESKEGTNFNSKEQYNNLCNILRKYSKEELKLLRDEWINIGFFYTQHRDKEYEFLHKNNGGIINGGNDSFYMDFKNWLVAQGKELYDSYEKLGIVSVLSYIINNNIKEDDFIYECMIYAFDNEE